MDIFQNGLTSDCLTLSDKVGEGVSPQKDCLTLSDTMGEGGSSRNSRNFVLRNKEMVTKDAITFVCIILEQD